MSVHFEKIKIKQVRKEIADCVSISFDIPEELQEKFQYQAGQYITLRTYINGEELRRSYSLCSSPLENEWRIAVKKTEYGLFSTFANEQLKAGDVLELMPPLGNFFTPFNKTNKKKYVLIAAGSGITPIISIIKTALAVEPHASVTLVYGNRHRHLIIFKEQLEALKNKYIDRLQLIYVLSREMTDATINHGRIDALKCDQLFTKHININADEFFICGPSKMIFCVKNYLLSKAVEENKIHFELFTTPEQLRTSHSIPHTSSIDEPKSKVTIKQDGISFGFDLSFDDENILDAALHHGADLPYSCKGGVCCTCRAKLIEGEVEMEVNYALEPWEVKQGFILVCQSHPKTEKVVIDFDVK
ncbi:MAG: 1,2-phenylacetyl-CoA epoxidase subunit PaaE [Chitinophagaceae bacterium]